MEDLDYLLKELNKYRNNKNYRQILEELQTNIIKINNVRIIYKFAKYVIDADISLLEDIIIKTNNPRYIYLFAKDVSGANISLLEDAIIATKDVDYIYLFAKDVANTNVLRLKNVIKTFDSEKYENLFNQENKNITSQHPIDSLEICYEKLKRELKY